MVQLVSGEDEAITLRRRNADGRKWGVCVWGGGGLCRLHLRREITEPPPQPAQPSKTGDDGRGKNKTNTREIVVKGTNLYTPSPKGEERAARWCWGGPEATEGERGTRDAYLPSETRNSPGSSLLPSRQEGRPARG